MRDNQQKIYFIEVLRGIAPLLVVGYHASGPLIHAYDSFPGLGLDLFRNGNIGVDIFFMISGFIICFATRRVEQKPLITFALRRFFRIYPLFIICLLIVWATYYSGKSPLDFLRSALFLQADYSSRAPFFGYNMLYPAWTISFEVLFYLVFLIGMFFSHNLRGLICTAIILASIISIQYGFKGELSLAGTYSSYDDRMGVFAPLLTLLGSPMLLEFIYGMVAYYVFMSLPKHISIKWTLFFLPMLCCGIYAFIHVNTFNHGFTDKGMLAMLIFTSLMMIEKAGVRLSFRLTRFLSDISYSLYLTHAIFLSIYLIYLRSIGLSEYPKGFISFTFIFGSCILISYIFHITIERPFISIGKKVVDIFN